jgi:GT2 family glycosyltransferase
MQTSQSDQIPKVGIVILNWRRPHEVLACLESLSVLDYPNYEIVVVDNSPDSDFQRIAKGSLPARCCVVENGQNLGFAGGCNVGIQFLLNRGTDYVLLLNDDTEVSPGLLRVLVETAERDPRIGLLGPKIYYHNRRNVIWSAGGSLTRHGQPGHLRVDEVDEGSPERIRDVDYITGCALFARRALIETVGPLDPRFFAYFEETEWCARARRGGYRVVYVPTAFIWHKIESADRSYSPLYLYLMTRNRLLYLRCSGATPVTIASAALDLLRTALSWSIKPKHSAMKPLAGVLVRGIFDFALGRFGAPPAYL